MQEIQKKILEKKIHEGQVFSFFCVMSFGDQCVISYTNPIYFPLRVESFQNISLELRDDAGVLIPFQFGRTIVTLHFKRDEKL